MAEQLVIGRQAPLPKINVAATAAIWNNQRQLLDAAYTGVLKAYAAITSIPDKYVDLVRLGEGLEDQFVVRGNGRYAKMLERFGRSAPHVRENRLKNFPPLDAHQINVASLIGVLNEYLKELPFDGLFVLVVESELILGQDFVLGSTFSGFPEAAVSTYHALTVPMEESDRSLLVRRIARHEVGHLLGLVSPDRDPRYLEKDGDGGSPGEHCVNTCTMRTRTKEQKDDILHYLEYLRAEDAFYPSHPHFCEVCMRELRDRWEENLTM